MKRQIISGFAMSLILTAAAFGSSENAQKSPGGEKQITIRIRDYAQTTPSVLHYAEQVAGELLQKAGADTRWIECPVGSPSVGECASPVSSLVLIVNLIPHSMSDRLHHAGGVLGFAIEATDSKFGYASSIFYDEVQERAEEHQLNVGDLLGVPTAHELGHLLLGTNSHSNAGLMGAFWSGNQLRLVAQGCLMFSGTETKRIHTAMTARRLAAAVRVETAESSPVASSEEQLAARGNR